MLSKEERSQIFELGFSRGVDLFINFSINQIRRRGSGVLTAEEKAATKEFARSSIRFEMLRLLRTGLMSEEAMLSYAAGIAALSIEVTGKKEYTDTEIMDVVTFSMY